MCTFRDIYFSIGSLLIHYFQDHISVLDAKNCYPSITEMRGFRKKREKKKKIIDEILDQF